MPELILASTSPARRALMDTLGIPYSVEAPGVEEDVAPGTSVRNAVVELAERKARAVHARHPEAFVLGADQMVSVGDAALGKPKGREDARTQLQRLSETPHELWTGVSLLTPAGGHTSEMEGTRLTLYPFAPGELERYLDTGEWEGCAGGYRVESLGQWLMQDIQGDRTNVQGLPMLTVVRMLRGAGFRRF